MAKATEPIPNTLLWSWNLQDGPWSCSVGLIVITNMVCERCW